MNCVCSHADNCRLAGINFMNSKTYCLIYQAGIANTFKDVSQTKRHKWLRLHQTDFRTAENFCRGLREMGAVVKVGWCNEAGDVAQGWWKFSEFEQAPFNSSFSSDFVKQSV